MIVLLLYEMDFYYRNYFLFISRRSMYCIKKKRIYVSSYEFIWSKGILFMIFVDIILEKWCLNNFYIFFVDEMVLKMGRFFGIMGFLINFFYFRFGNIVVMFWIKL